MANPSSAIAAGGGDEFNEDVVLYCGWSECARGHFLPTGFTYLNETSTDDSEVVCHCVSLKIELGPMLARALEMLFIDYAVALTRSGRG